MAREPRLYRELAHWWPLFSKPTDYAEEADFARRTLIEAGSSPRTVLELGSGGGNNASYLKRQFELTLVDLSPGMLKVSRALNPECEHIAGDMRKLQLGRLFDAVFIHDAIMYMTSLEDLRRAIETAFVHCRTQGSVLIMPDFVRETFVNGIHNHGGHDGIGRGLRYIEWTFDADPTDTVYTIDFAYLLREGNSPVQIEHDTHPHGLFSRDQWTGVLADVGFASRIVKDPYNREVFVATKA